MGSPDKRKHTKEMMLEISMDFIGIQQTSLKDFRDI
jgi:hypothetical protein